MKSLEVVEDRAVVRFPDQKKMTTQQAQDLAAKILREKGYAAVSLLGVGRSDGRWRVSYVVRQDAVTGVVEP